MEKLVVIELNGNFQQGFDATLEIREGGVNSPAPVRVKGKLPKNEDVRYNYLQWQQRYLNLEGLWWRGLKERNSAQVLNASERKKAFEACDAAAGVVEKSLNDWLDKSEDFDKIRQALLRELQSGATIRVLLQTDNSELRRLPWNRCHLLASAEVGLSAPEYDCKNKPNPPARKNKVRILAVLGHATDLPHQGENRRVLDELAKKAGGEIVWKEQPALDELNQLLSEQCWDILFFSGHSQSNQEGKRCEINLTETHRLSVTEIRVSLKKAMAGGLRLAIFNSCDGLGLAHQLAAEKDLYLPQVIVMREKVPDAVSPKFLEFFLSAFTAGDSLYASMWEARRLLREECDKDYPCASWMPVICQNPAIEPATWLQLLGIPPCPYRGLSAFRETDAPFFFGRERFAKQLLEAVRKNALVPVIGASGLGKSSVVFAGLIPLLRQWDSSEMPVRIVSFRPGKDPCAALAVAIAELGRSQEDAPATGTLASDSRQFLPSNPAGGEGGKIIDRIAPETRVVLVADQFEELYTLTEDEPVRRRFLDSLLRAVNSAPRFTLVLTLRADFFPAAIAYPPFAEALKQCELQFLSPMSREELQEAIEKPAAKMKVRLEEELGKRLIDAVWEQSGHLPLLEFVLTQLWERQANQTLTHKAYAEIGGVEAALANYAESVYSQLSEGDRKKAEKVFIQLVHPGAGTKDTRRVVTGADLNEENWDLVRRLADARLVVTDSNQKTGEETVEMVHEALIEHWGRLRRWVGASREFRTWQDELQPAIAQWESGDRDSRAVLGGIALDVAEVWLLQRGEELSERERVFVERSLELRDRLRQEEEEIISLSKRDRARMWVNGYAITGAAIVIAGLPRVSFPGSTAAALMVIEAEMCFEIGKIYRGDNFTFTEAVAAAGVVGLVAVAGKIAALEALTLVPFALARQSAKALIARDLIKGLGEAVIAYYERVCD